MKINKQRLKQLWLGKACLLFVFVFCVLIFNCETEAQWYKKWGPKPQPTAPVVFQKTPTQQELLGLFAARYQSFRQLNASVTVSMSGMPKVKGDFQLELPNRMRLKAGVMGVSQLGIDMGSNENQFWIWSKASLPGQPPAFYYANHAEFKQSAVHQNIPLDPQWLIDAIGMMNPAPTDQFHGPFLGEDGRLKLFTIRATPSGPQIRQTLISATTGLIEQQAIYNSANRRLAYSNSKNHKLYSVGQSGQAISLPQQVEIFIDQPGGIEEKIVIDLGKFAIDSLFGDPNKMWTMPKPGNGVKQINLAQVAIPNQTPTMQNGQNSRLRQSQPNGSPFPQPQTGYRQGPFNR